MRPVAPRIDGTVELTFAEEQPEYLPITVAIIPDHGEAPSLGRRLLVTRYQLNAEERKRVAEGADIYFAQLNFGGPMTPQQAGLRDTFAPDPER